MSLREEHMELIHKNKTVAGGSQVCIGENVRVA